MRKTTLFAAVVLLLLGAVALPRMPRVGGAGEWVLLLLFLGLSAYVCYDQAKKKHRNTALAIVLGVFLNWMAVVVYLIIPNRSIIPARPDAPVVPPDPDFQGYRSIRAGCIGAVVGVLASLVVLGLASSLTGGEGDLGPGLVMLMAFGGGVIAVSYLGVAAIWHGVSSLDKAREAGRPTRARIGIALGALDLAAVGAVVWTAANAGN